MNLLLTQYATITTRCDMKHFNIYVISFPLFLQLFDITVEHYYTQDMLPKIKRTTKAHYRCDWAYSKTFDCFFRNSQSRITWKHKILNSFESIILNPIDSNEKAKLTYDYSLHSNNHLLSISFRNSITLDLKTFLALGSILQKLKNWLMSEIYPRGLTIYQQSFGLIISKIHILLTDRL